LIGSRPAKPLPLAAIKAVNDASSQCKADDN
jgi:hypothetical protein